MSFWEVHSARRALRRWRLYARVVRLGEEEDETGRLLERAFNWWRGMAQHYRRYAGNRVEPWQRKRKYESAVRHQQGGGCLLWSDTVQRLGLTACHAHQTALLHLQHQGQAAWGGPMAAAGLGDGVWLVGGACRAAWRWHRAEDCRGPARLGGGQPSGLLSSLAAVSGSSGDRARARCSL